MTGFAIFALLLTFGYVVYFIVLITMDLHQKKDFSKNEEDNFDMPDANEDLEEPKEIAEKQDGADAGFFTYTDQTDDDGLRVVAPSGNVPSIEPTDTDSELEPTAEPQVESRTSEEINEENEDFMEDIDPGFQLSLVADEYIGELQQKHNQRIISKTNVIDNL